MSLPLDSPTLDVRCKIRHELWSAVWRVNNIRNHGMQLFDAFAVTANVGNEVSARAQALAKPPLNARRSFLSVAQPQGEPGDANA